MILRQALIRIALMSHTLCVIALPTAALPVANPLTETYQCPDKLPCHVDSGGMLCSLDNTDNPLGLKVMGQSFVEGVTGNFLLPFHHVELANIALADKQRGTLRCYYGLKDSHQQDLVFGLLSTTPNKVFTPVNNTFWSIPYNSCMKSPEDCRFNKASKTGLQLTSSDMTNRYPNTILVLKRQQELKGQLVITNTTPTTIENITITMSNKIILSGSANCQTLPSGAKCHLHYDLEYADLQDYQSYIVTIYGTNDSSQHYFNQIRFLVLPWGAEVHNAIKAWHMKSMRVKK